VAASRTDDPERGKSLFVEALETAREQGGRFEILQCLEGLAGVAADRGQADHAACLFGAAERLRKEIGAELPFGLQLDYDRDVAAVRSHLGGEQFQAAWSAGSALTMRQAIDRALQGPEEAGPAVAEAPEARPLTALQAAKREYGGLTTRERQVAGLVAQGKTNAAIAQELVVTVRTVEAHMTHIFSKLGFLSRTQVAGWAIGRGLALPPRTLDESMRAK
jgi:DNA-binding CsgD family transcriptional regulator